MVMNELEKEVFEMYRNTMKDKHCRRCYEMAKNEERTLNPPISFWNLGTNFGDKSKPRIAFVGKTSWMSPDDIETFGKKIGPIYDIRRATDYFFGNDIKRYRYWRAIKKISQKVHSTKQDPLEFLENIFITNLVKCNFLECQDSYENITGFEYFSNCLDIFEKEIEIVKPSHVIFFTNDYYDSLVDDLHFGYEDSDCEWEDLSSKYHRKQVSQRAIKNKNVSWWHRVFREGGTPKMHFLRTRHPQGAPAEFEDEIVHWIRKWRNSP